MSLSFSSHSVSRRQFLGQLAGVTAFSASVPSFLVNTAATCFGDERRQIEPIPGLDDNRVLVVIHLEGGNDGLNTLIPYTDDLYHKARPNLAIPTKDVLKLNDWAGLHPQLVEFRRLLDDGHLGIVQHVGYPNSDRSHFRSTEIWQTASSSDQAWTTGWLARYFDESCGRAVTPCLGVQIGQKQAQAFDGPNARAVSASDLALFKAPGEGLAAEGVRELNRVRDIKVGPLDFVQRTANDSLKVADRIQAALKHEQTDVEYLPFPFSQQLKTVGQMIVAGLPSRVFYVSLAGFDHHARQANSHAALLQELAEGLSSFQRHLKVTGNLDRTLVMTFSEFGRRVAENKSGGTDHGAGGLMFLMGGTTRPGLQGAAPNLSDLDSGDLKHSIDFRQVYAAVLKNWLKADPSRVLQGSFTPADVLT